MNNLEIYFKQALLAQAAYADLSGNVQEDSASLQQTAAFPEQWTVVTQYSDAITSAFATVIEEKARVDL